MLGPDFLLIETELVFLLNNMGSAKDVVSALQRQNIYASFDPNLTLAWELLQTQCWQTALLSVGLLACAVALIWEKRSAEITKTRSETEMLLLSGMTADAVGSIYPLRIALTGLACTLTASLIALILGTFSLIAVGIGICAAGVTSHSKSKQSKRITVQSSHTSISVKQTSVLLTKR